MTICTTASFAKACRRAAVPACDPIAEYAGTNPPSVDGSLMMVRKGDIIDVGIDWSAWLSANDGALATSAWAAHADSPATPTISANGIDQSLGQTVAILDTSANAIGDTFWLENTVTISDATPSTPNGYAMPARTLKRIIHVKVVT